MLLYLGEILALCCASTYIQEERMYAYLDEIDHLSKAVVMFPVCLKISPTFFEISLKISSYPTQPSSEAAT